MDCHKEAVRVLLTMKTLASVSSTRVSKFISDEQVRNLRQSSIIRSQENGDVLDSFEDSFLDSHEEGNEESVSLAEPPSPSLLQYLRRRPAEMPRVTLHNGTVIDTRSPSPLEPPLITFSSSGRVRNRGAVGLQEEPQPVEDEFQSSETASRVTAAEVHPLPYETVVSVAERPDAVESAAESETELDQSAATEIVSAEDEEREPPLPETGTTLTEEACDYEESPALKAPGGPPETATTPTEEACDYEESPALKAPVGLPETGTTPTEEACHYEVSPALKAPVGLPETGTTPTEEACDYEESPALKSPGGMLQQRVASGSLGFIDAGPLATVASPEGQDFEETTVLEDTQIELEVEGESGLERVASPDSAVSSSSHGYDTVHSGSAEASPYEDPTTLEHGGPVSATPVLFSPVASTSVVPTIPGRSTEPQEGAVFLLTAGRGLMNLRPGYRTAVLFPTPGSTAASSNDCDEGCLIAYEIEH